MKFANFTLEKISPKYYQLLFNYYNGNKNHLEPWEPTRAENYYYLNKSYLDGCHLFYNYQL